MQLLRSVLNQFVPLKEPEWRALSSLFRPYTLAVHAQFASENRRERQIGFLEQGVIRAYYRNSKGNEYNKTFFVNGDFFGAYTSLVTGQPNKINIQALTESEIYAANYHEFVKLFKKYRNIETLARILAEQFYVYKEKREIELVLLDAEHRYQIFQKEYPGLQELIPQYHIASYLGITPTQLSRIRAKKARW